MKEFVIFQNTLFTENYYCVTTIYSSISKKTWNRTVVYHKPSYMEENIFLIKISNDFNKVLNKYRRGEQFTIL